MTSGADRVAATVARHSSIEAWCEREFGSPVLPAVRDPKRRASCARNLPRFLRTYLPSIFFRPFSPAALRFLRDLQRLMLSGGLKAIAEPRGMGKTATISGAMIWAAVYGHRRYLVAVAAKDEMAVQLVKDLVAHIPGEMFLADFPEYAIPFLAVGGKSQRCASQTYRGKATGIAQKVDAVTLPSISGGKGDGAIIQGVGLTGSIRGMHQVDKNRKWVRPDFVLLDDPQTRESAKSPSQTDDRERIILGDVMGLAGHDADISAAMACTVIEKDDLSERFLDTAKRPEWRGQRERLVTKWGGTNALWEEYDALWREEEAGRAPAGSALKWWRGHPEIEKGCKVLDPHLYGRNEASALQHARNLLLKHGETAFLAEYQNDPPSLTPDAPYRLVSEDVLKKAGAFGHGVVPDDAKKVVAAVDVNRYALAWCVAALRQNGALSVIDYGWWTPRGRDCVWPENSTEAGDLIAAGIVAVVGRILGNSQYGEEVRTIGVDSNYETQVVRNLMPELQRRYQHRRVVASRAYPGKDYRLPTDRAVRFLDGREADLRWAKGNRRAVECHYDSHYWHMRTQKGWLMPPGANGSTEVFSIRPVDRHRRFADQATADHLVKVEIAGNGRQMATWSTHEHNEMGDCLAMCGAFASLGEKLVDVTDKTPEKAENPPENGQKTAEKAPEKAEKPPENVQKTPVPAPRRRRVMMPGWH